MRYGVYVHVPWCRSRCHYCSFNVHVRQDIPWGAYVDAVLRQWEDLRPDHAPATLYLGGGTPSLMPPAHLERLVQAIGADFTEMEANPEDLQTLGDWPIDRLSVGAQTFQAEQMAFLNRRHPDLSQRLRAVRERFPTWSLDLIFGLPGQGRADLDRDLDALLEANPPHVSLYGLTAHPGTAFHTHVERGRFTLDDHQQADMFEHIAERLHASGRHRYEVSNFARPDHRSPHNELVWRGNPYLGLGPGAHGLMPDGRRTIGQPDPQAFIDRPGFSHVERPAPKQAAVDHLLGAMRHVDGVAIDALEKRGFTVNAHRLQGHVSHRTLAIGERIALTGRGWLFADRLIADVATALVPLT